MKIRPFVNSCLLLILLLLFEIPLFSQDDQVKKIFSGTRSGLTQSSDLPYQGEFFFVLGHRFGNIKGGFYDIFGLDLATIRLGFEYGISDNLEVGFGRSSFEKTYDLFGKVAIAKQSAGGFPLAVTVNIASSVNTLKNTYPPDMDGIWERMSFSAQVIVGRRQDRLSLQASPMFFRNNYETRDMDDLNLFALPLTVSYRFAKRFSFTTQYIPVFNKPDFAGDNPLSFGIDIDTGGHQFQLLFANSTGLFDKSLLTNTDGSWSNGNIFFGFTLSRVFYFKDKK